MNNIKLNFSNNLQRILKSKDLTQAEIAAAINVTPQVISAWIKQKSSPRMEKLQDLGNFLGIEPSELIQDETKQFKLETNEMQIIRAYREDDSARTAINSIMVMVKEKEKEPFTGLNEAKKSS